MAYLNKAVLAFVRRSPAHIIQRLTRVFSALPALAVPLERNMLIWNEGSHFSPPNVRSDSSHGDMKGMLQSPASVHTGARKPYGKNIFAGNSETIAANAMVMEFVAKATAAGVRLED